MMSEVMTCSTVDEKFSFSKAKREQMQTKKELDQLNSSEVEDESTLSFNDKLDIASIKSSENTICGSDDSAVSQSNSGKNSNNITDDVQDSANSTIKSDTSCEDYEYMTTETAMIDTTSTMIETASQSHTNDLNALSNSQCAIFSNTENNIDSKRVVVQILSSEAKDTSKSVGVFENKSVNESQSTNSFRDDVCKLLTRPSSKPSLDYGSDTLEEKDLKDTTSSVSRNSVQKISSKSSIKRSVSMSRNSVHKTPPNKRSKKTERNQRRSSINPLFLYNKGPRFHELKHISKHLKAATASALRAIHFMLYDKYGLCGSEMQLARTRRRILRFSGYPFDLNSAKYHKKLKSLLKMPIEMLLEVHEAIFGKTPPLERTHMANNLMTLFSDTERYEEITSLLKQTVKFIPESEYVILKEKAFLDPPPTVMLEKLNSDILNHALSIRDSDIKMKMKKEKLESRALKIKEKAAKMSENQAADEPSYDLPAYILKGPGKKLKQFRGIVENVKKADQEVLNLLHRLLYGRDESIDICKRNILEFSGFLECQNEFIYNVHDTLNRLDGAEILKICRILCLRASTNSRNRRIMKVMEYLKRPFNPSKIKVTGFRQKIFPKTWQKRIPKTFELTHPTIESRVPFHPLKMWDEPENAECDDGGYRLRDFRKICSNIECSAPSDLTELNDLLFMKPSDDIEIHDRILNFTRFGFSESSIHYHYRKTLMFYMGPSIVRKIARLLDIANWNLISNHEDLSGYILNFLMQKKIPDSFRVKPCATSLSFPISTVHNPSNQLEISPENKFPAQFAQKSNQTTTFRQENVVISVSKSTVLADLNSCDPEYSYNESQKKIDHMIPGAGNEEDDFVPLRDFIHHPTDDELRGVIDDIVKTGLFSITLGDVVRKVYLKYPCFNLTYREQFIKSETRKVVSMLRQIAVEKMKQNSIT